jgi:hypothetical protein
MRGLAVLSVTKQTSGHMLGHRNFDDWIETSGNQVHLTVHGCRQRIYTLPFEAGAVVGVEWARFSRRQSTEEGDHDCLCVLQPELLTIYEADGPVHAVPLPSRATALWPACDGLIVDCQPAGAIGACAENNRPLIFSLLHPLEEPRRLGFANIVVNNDMEDATQNVLFVSNQNDAPLVVTYNSYRNCLTAWVIWSVHVMWQYTGCRRCIAVEYALAQVERRRAALRGIRKHRRCPIRSHP